MEELLARMTLIYESAVENFRLNPAGIVCCEMINKRPMLSLRAKCVLMAGVVGAGMFLARTFTHFYGKGSRVQSRVFHSLNRTYCSSKNKDSIMKITQNIPKLKFVLASSNAFPPSKASKYAAGYDLRSAYDCVVPAKGKYTCSTDLIIAIPEGCYGRVAPRSGLTVKNFIDVGAGVIDCDYRGHVGVVLFNFGVEDYKVEKGDRIAQLICEKIAYPDLEQVDSLDETGRGEGGFGSSGKN